MTGDFVSALNFLIASTLEMIRPTVVKIKAFIQQVVQENNYMEGNLELIA